MPVKTSSTADEEQLEHLVRVEAHRDAAVSEPLGLAISTTSRCIHMLGLIGVKVSAGRTAGMRNDIRLSTAIIIRVFITTGFGGAVTIAESLS
jgi:hypothetical protein